MGLRLTDMSDGTSNTFALGEAAGGSLNYPLRDLTNPSQMAINPLTGEEALAEQSWSAAGIDNTTHPWYASVFGVTAQFIGDAPAARWRHLRAV